MKKQIIDFVNKWFTKTKEESTDPNKNMLIECSPGKPSDCKKSTDKSYDCTKCNFIHRFTIDKKTTEIEEKPKYRLSIRTLVISNLIALLIAITHGIVIRQKNHLSSAEVRAYTTGYTHATDKVLQMLVDRYRRDSIFISKFYGSDTLIAPYVSPEKYDEK